MNTLFIDLPADVRNRLIGALDSGYLALNCTATGLRSALGSLENPEELVAALHELHELGMSPRGAAVALRGINSVLDRQRKPDLVLSGLQPDGTFARDTQRVYAELLGNAEHSVWLSSFVYYNGPRVFEALAKRMAERPALQVNLLLNIQRKWGDLTPSEQIVQSFAQKLWQRDWPGARRPQVYYDPRSLEPERDEAGQTLGHAVLHAKAAVIDNETLFITSANLTEAAGERNIEIGILLRDRSMALSVIVYFQRLINGGHLRRLPG